MNSVVRCFSLGETTKHEDIKKLVYALGTSFKRKESVDVKEKTFQKLEKLIKGTENN